MLKRILFSLAIVFIATTISKAQVTTSSITGAVKDDKGQPLTGATIVAVHEPSGTQYSTTSSKTGTFTIPGVRVGGPYKVTISFVGLQPAIFENITVQLGEAYDINADLNVNQQTLENVVVTTTRSRRSSTEKTGMASVINSRQLATIPTISRSITDFTRATPQANGNNFGGRDARYNNITVDGANLNNNFGLSSDPLPGAGNNPVSLDAIEEVSVSLAPYDVRQGNFTGANIAAITKSGTNTIHGTAYYFWQSEQLRGAKIGNVKANNPAFKSTVYGISIGGPIIKNKLFYFINGELEEKPPSAGITWSPKGGSGTGNISDVPVDSLKAVSNYLNSAHKYDPGVYDNFPAFENDNHKLLIKLDWNISTKNKLSLKFSDFKGEQDFSPSQSGNIGGTFSGATYGPKFSNSAMGFSSVLYQQIDIVQSGSIEFNSNLNKKMSSQFLATFTRIKNDKAHEGPNFPFVDILGATPGDRRNFISVGNEPFNGNNNKVINDIFSVTENFSYYAGKHNLTGGVSYEYQKVGNMFMRGSQGYYVFASVSDFINNRPPLKFAQTYSLIEGQDAVFSAELKIGQLSIYAQDEFNVNPKFKLTFGVRVDKPIYPEQPLENKANSALTFNDLEGNVVNYSTGRWPEPKALFSPRVGFRYDIHGDKSFIARGGTGLFTGRIPYVYLTNIPTNSGMYQYSASINNTSAGINMSNYLFNPDPHAYNPFYKSGLPGNYFPTTAGTVASADFVVVDPDYKFPQVWRTDLAIDRHFGKSWKLTVEALYTKDINATYMFDANQKAPDATVKTGSYTRGYYSNAAARRINSAISGNAIVLASTNEGSTFVFTTQLERTFAKGFYGSLAYTYTYASNLTENPGSQASSVWTANATGRTLNDFELAYTNFAVPHRFVGNVSYRFEYLKHAATTLTLVYEGAINGTYSYVYNGSLNNQGLASANLMYIPTNARNSAEILFRNNVTYANGVTYTAAEQAQLFENFIQQDPYLRKHRGQVAERNGAKRPWYDRFDLKFIQDIFTKVGSRRHTLQFTADIYNITNLLHNRWGVRKIYTVNNPLRVESVTNGVPTFSITAYNGAPVTQTFVSNISTSTTWAMQLGLRYIF
ncbi:MAG TPA: carboxypeptidase regulatory-like domain-containing protein [Chitinophagaceae bacterium]|nr:carboxypeptidase regulatory-like domain-containing protein [Chitinophagaceae bacterium]